MGEGDRGLNGIVNHVVSLLYRDPLSEITYRRIILFKRPSVVSSWFWVGQTNGGKIEADVIGLE